MSHLINFKTVLELKRYSENTIQAYISFIKIFKNYFEYTDELLENLQDKDIITSLIKLISDKKYSMSSQKQLLGAIKLFYNEILKRNIDLSIIYPTRKTRHLPYILSKNEVKKMLEVTKNTKHKALLATIYSLGLRSSEVIALKIKDIDSDRMLVSIKNSKGNRDRIIMLSEKLLKILRNYFKEYRPKEYLFEGQKKEMYSSSSLRKVFHKAKESAMINKPVTVHSLRHSFATHLLENGTDIRIIQKLLGHKSINTTLLYTQVASSTIQNVKSPLDSL